MPSAESGCYTYPNALLRVGLSTRTRLQVLVALRRVGLLPPEQGCKSLLPSAESGFCHPNKVASPSTQPGFLSYPRWDRAEPKIPACDPEPNADASGPFLTWDAVDNKVLIFLPLSAVSNDEGELPHIQKSDEKESRSTTFIHCDACASSKTGEGELVSNGFVGPPVCGVGLRRGARPTLPNTGEPRRSLDVPVDAAH